MNVGFFWDGCVRFHRRDYKTEQNQLCADTTLVQVPTFFLAIAVMLTINKWIYFNMRLMINVKMNKYEELMQETAEQSDSSS